MIEKRAFIAAKWLPLLLMLNAPVPPFVLGRQLLHNSSEQRYFKHVYDCIVSQRKWLDTPKDKNVDRGMNDQ